MAAMVLGKPLRLVEVNDTPNSRINLRSTPTIASRSCAPCIRDSEGQAEYGVLAKAGDSQGDRFTNRINVRANPSTSATSPYYGVQGDVVQLLNQKNTNDGYVSRFVQFPSGAKGWVRSDLISRMDGGSC